jgi:hypothetical protein
VGRGTQCLFKGIGTYQRGRTIVLVFLEHVLRNVYPTVFSVQFLHTALSWEDVCKVINAKGLFGNRVDRWHGFIRHVGLNVVPLCRNLTLLKEEFFLFSHNVKFWGLRYPPAKVQLFMELKELKELKGVKRYYFFV